MIAPTIDLDVSPADDLGRRRVSLRANGYSEIRDLLATDSAFARGKLVERAKQEFRLDVDAAKELDAEILSAADEIDRKANGTERVRFDAVSFDDLMGMEIMLRFIVDPLIVEGQPLVIGGPQKSLKTSLLLDLALSMATGGHFLGRFPVPERRNVGVLTGESGMGTVQETLRRIARAAWIESAPNLWITDRVPRFANPAHRDALREFIVEHDLQVVAIDPAYLAIEGDTQAVLASAGEQFQMVNEMVAASGCTLVICHHSKRETARKYDPLDLADLHGSGWPEWARQWMLVNRREAYTPGTGDHHLWLSAGGSAGHGGLWAVDVAEGLRTDPGGRRWEVTVQDAEEARQSVRDREADRKADQAAKRAEQTQEKRKTAIVRALGTLGGKGTARAIRNATGLSGVTFGPAVFALISEGRVRQCSLGTGGQEGYELGGDE